MTIEDLLRLRHEHLKQPKRKHRKSHGNIGFHELNRIVSNRWKSLTESEKEIFEQQALLEKEDHARRVKEWEAQQKATRGVTQFVVDRRESSFGSTSAAHNSFGDLSIGDLTLGIFSEASQSISGASHGSASNLWQSNLSHPGPANLSFTETSSLQVARVATPRHHVANTIEPSSFHDILPCTTAQQHPAQIRSQDLFTRASTPVQLGGSATSSRPMWADLSAPLDPSEMDHIFD